MRQAANDQAPRGFRDLQARAQATLTARNISQALPDPDTYYTYFSWHDAEQVQRLQTILDANLIPQVEIYESPLTMIDGVRLTGAIASGFLAFLLLVVGPILVGTQIAQEVHENTLMPLTGTSLRTRELVLGLSTGPLSIVALLAIPQALILLLTVAFAGYLLPALAGILVALVGCFFLSVLAQLVGFALGSRHTPGVLGMAMLSFFGILAMIGSAIGMLPSREGIGILALLPEAATAHLFRSSLLPHELFLNNWRLAHDADFAIAIGTVGIGLLGLLGLRALERKVARKGSSALTRGEGMLGALVTIVLVALANPASQHSYNATEGFILVNLALLSVPFAILLMMRTPTPDLGEKRKAPPIAKLLGELFAWTGILGMLSVSMLSTTWEPTSPLPALFFFCLLLTWYLSVIGLVAIRMASAPMRLITRLQIGGALFFALMTFPQMAAALRGVDGPQLLIFSEISPFLGFVQAAMLVVVPWALLRSIRRSSC
ncbi:MAG TPA: hypothetical protein ENK31_09400 [Nannocystis exedens]|nr:hypothetical protein [Nannocystis exedens]